MVRCEVIGQLPIVDAETGQDVVRGGEVTLDPERTNIRALEDAGLVRVLPAKKASK